MTLPQMEMLLAGVPEYERSEAFNIGQPIAALWAEHLNSYGGKRPRRRREGEPEEPPLEEHERFNWLEIMRHFTPWALPEDIRAPKLEVSPELAREILDAINMNWVPPWVRKYADVWMLERAAAQAPEEE
jgi:hypothetical protein